ncbi:hypothetical protein K435DRAFT_873405 [Dendrothele bispora CBS 962.96]|uniref:Uncharacterized protein n=1 Tax=Dendrothele bispora (strain CBS 962.96) TaxID=1314807 RepID=A0A4S8KZE8_DENBC|nr:hypothetical protein K435DRAFT_873405 [Dendrothele bispora CBS 962.96]
MDEHWPKEIRPRHRLNIVPAIGKFHEPAHLQKNHQQYSLNLIKGVGMTDGEGSERIWSAHNAVSYSTRPMAPGTRHDILDDHFVAWNWLKLSNAILAGRKGCRRSFVEKWKMLCVGWENAPFPKSEVENPFEVTEEFMAEEEALKELELEDEERRKKGGVKWNDVSGPGFVAMGLELELLCLDLRNTIKKHVTDNNRQEGRQPTLREKSFVEEQWNPLQEKLAVYERLQAIYMPGLLQFLVDIGEEVEGVSSDTTSPEDVKLWLPSSVPTDRRSLVCMEGIVAAEDRLRTVHCNSAIHALRHTLRVKSRMVIFKNANVVGQRPVARAAKLALVGPGTWEETLKVLKDSDVTSYRDQSWFKVGSGRRGLNEDSWEPEPEVSSGRTGSGEDGENVVLLNEVRSDRRGLVTRREHVPREGTGETRQQNSSIWTSGPGMRLEDGADENNEICRSEWCRSRARARRATEEVMLLKEEMKRTILFLEWKEKWWLKKKTARDMETELEYGICEGLGAYAAKQATLYRGLALSFHSIWSQPLRDVDSFPAMTEVIDNTNGDGDEDEDEDEDEDDAENDDDNCNDNNRAGKGQEE